MSVHISYLRYEQTVHLEFSIKLTKILPKSFEQHGSVVFPAFADKKLKECGYHRAWELRCTPENTTHHPSLGQRVGLNYTITASLRRQLEKMGGSASFQVRLQVLKMGNRKHICGRFGERLRDAGKDRNLVFVRTGLMLNSVRNTEEFSQKLNLTPSMRLQDRLLLGLNGFVFML